MLLWLDRTGMAKMRNDKLREEFDAAEPVRLTVCAPLQETRTDAHQLAGEATGA